MRITIEVDQETKSMPTTAAQEQPASDAGSPPERLLAEIGTASEATASAQPANAGAPPTWLVEAMAAAASGEPGVSGAAMKEAATVFDGGTAPAGA